MRFKNTSKESIAYRDDSGKHIVEPGGEWDLVGDQHEEAMLAIPGVVRIDGVQPEPEVRKAQVTAKVKEED